jgi:hypothetical protein
VALLGFHCIPKGVHAWSYSGQGLSIDWSFKVDRDAADDAVFQHFRRQLYHSTLSKILASLKPGMTTPEVIRFPDGHFRKGIYGLGPFIGDYPEQALTTCIVQGWCPK